MQSSLKVILAFSLLLGSEALLANKVARRSHLGDGVHSHHYFFISDHLKSHKGSKELTQQTMQAEQEAAKAPTQLKPPSANLVESEVSHLLGAVCKDNSLIGAAVFDRFGLKVISSGPQLLPMTLEQKMLARIGKLGIDGTIETALTCEEMKQLKLGCKGKATQVFRKVIDYGTDKYVGASWVVFRD